MSVPKVYILGAGAMGCLVGHEISQSFSKQIQPALLFRNNERLQDFIRSNSEITVVKQSGPNISSSRSKFLGAYRPPNETIDNLIISTKTYQTEKALSPYIPFLTPSSNVLILQNGMGMTGHLTEKFWPTENTRPKIFQAITTHGAYKTSPYNVIHAAQGKLSISYMPKSIEPPAFDIPEIPDLIKLLIDTKSLNTVYLKPQELILVQMEKLIVNSCINPLSAIMDCLNGDLLYGNSIVPVMKRVIHEAVQVFFAEYQILQVTPEARSFLSEDRLLSQVLRVCKDTAANSSSMREDVRALNQTEIDWMNGFISNLGFKHDISTPTNKMLSGMVKNKLSIERGIEKKAAGIALD